MGGIWVGWLGWQAVVEIEGQRDEACLDRENVGDGANLRLHMGRKVEMLVWAAGLWLIR